MLYSPQLYRKLHQTLGYLPHPIVPSSPLRLMFACAVYHSQEQTPVFNIPNDKLPRLGIPVILDHPSIALLAQLSILSLPWSRPTNPLKSTHHTPKYLTSDISYQTSLLRHWWVYLPFSDNLRLALKMKDKYKRMHLRKTSSLPSISLEIW